MVNETVFRRLVLGLERSEESLFRAENLHGARRVLCERHEAARVRDEPCADELAHEDGEIGGDRLHP